jgi:phospholipid/cholesterol/gamma-HCH transport system permease protein
MPARSVGALGRAAIELAGQCGQLALTGWDGARRLVRSLLPGERFRFQAAVEQLHLMGVQAVPIVSLIALMMGLILAFQSAHQLGQLGMEIYVADLVAVSMTRELGPVITAIVVAGRSGSSIAAELSTMKIQEELDALKVMGLNPGAFLLAPRLLAMLIALPILTAIADLISIIGGLICGTFILGLSLEQYLSRTEEALVLRDFVSGLGKAGVFAVLIVSVAAWCGFQVRGGAEGVGRATTRAVVLGIFLVIVGDLIFTGLFYKYAG